MSYRKLINPARKIDEARSFAPQYASAHIGMVRGALTVTIMATEGNFISTQFTVRSEAEGRADLIAMGFELT